MEETFASKKNDGERKDRSRQNKKKSKSKAKREGNGGDVVDGRGKPPSLGASRYPPYHQVKSRFTLLGGKKAICRGSGPDSRAGAGARVWSPLPPGLSKESGER